MNGVNFNTVYSGFLAQIGGFCKAVNHLLNFINRNRTAHHVLFPAGRKLTRACRKIIKVNYRLDKCFDSLVLLNGNKGIGKRKRASEAGGQLYKKLGSGLMNFTHKGLELCEHLFVLPKPASADRVAKRCNTGDNQTDIVFGSLKEKVRRFLVKMIRFHPTEKRGSAHRTQDNSVFDFDVTD